MYTAQEAQGRVPTTTLENYNGGRALAAEKQPSRIHNNGGCKRKSAAAMHYRGIATVVTARQTCDDDAFLQNCDHGR